jgi:2-dehydropantoate 2-reductase
LHITYRGLQLNIIIVGHGAIGSLWSYHLHQAGHNVSVSPRKSTDLAANEPEMVSLTLKGSNTIELKMANHHDFDQADLILFTIKSYQVEQAVTALLSSISEESILLFMHNGMGAIDPIEDVIKHNPVVIATTTHGALKTHSTTVAHTGLGITQIGGYNKKGQQCQFITDVFEHALPQNQWLDNIHEALWNKLAINCVINPLTAVEQCQNGQLSDTKYTHVIDQLISELVEVMNAEGVNTNFNTLSTRIKQVIDATSANYSSMNRDVAFKRQTEIDFITGYLLKVAKKHHITCPMSVQLFNSIKQIELSWSKS